jgi:hypothetical protein
MINSTAAKCQPDMQQNSFTAADAYNVKPAFCQTACYVQPKFASIRSLQSIRTCLIKEQKFVMSIQKLNSMPSRLVNPKPFALIHSHLLNQRTKACHVNSKAH